MTLKKHLKQHLGRKATRRIYKTMPWVGGVIALASVAQALLASEFLRSSPNRSSEPYDETISKRDMSS